MVMIGYSDSAKMRGYGRFWAQYRAQDALIKTCEKAGIELTLFHGRGGSIGRGGAPAHAALLSQPPGSLKGGLRVTEQGEMIRFKYGLPEVTISSLSLYTSAILEANLLPPPEPKAQWRDIMAELSDVSCEMYRGYVRENKDFVPYFRSATPEQELGKLPLGSRPAKRRPTGGVESLRAIPWIFAWTQNRLMLPAAGRRRRVAKVVEGGKQSDLGKHVPRLAVLLDPPRHAGDGLLKSRPVAGGILRSASGETRTVEARRRAAQTAVRRY